MAACPALFIAAPASGQGKTSVTAGIARHYRRLGHRVRLFKTGPDYLDPMLLERASGAPVFQLDLWMGGAAHCRALLLDAAMKADLILIEGVMGLYDGKPSSADLAQMFGIPVMLVIDAGAMAETFAAIATGLAHYRADLPLAGVLANRVGSERHAAMLRDSLGGTLPFLGALLRDADCALPSRHLGLLPPGEIADIEARLERLADRLGALLGDGLPAAVAFPSGDAAEPPPKLLAGRRIGVARDAAFSFLYPANLNLLGAMGADLIAFSPLDDPEPPDVDAIYLPGGYPELHLARLADNRSMAGRIREHVAAGRPLLAECGGLLYLLDRLADGKGNSADLVGLIPGHAEIGSRLANLGMQSVTLPEGSLRGHSFHHAHAEIGLTPIAQAEAQRQHGMGEPVYRINRLTASFFHVYFPSNPVAAARLFLP